MIDLEQPRPGVRLLRLSRAEQLNALTREMVDALHAALDQIEADADCRAVILTGAGRGFCSGQDMRAAEARNAEGGALVVERLHWQGRFATLGGRMRASTKCFIAAVNGPAAGAGMALALSADIRVVAPSAKFLVAAVKIGLSSGEGGISYLLPRLVGAGRAFEILLTGRPVLADEALRIGLATSIVEPEGLVEAALDVASQVSGNAPYSISHTKRLMWESLDAGYAAALAQENATQILGTQTDDYREATRAFTEKRPPNFSGR